MMELKQTKRPDDNGSGNINTLTIHGNEPLNERQKKNQRSRGRGKELKSDLIECSVLRDLYIFKIFSR